LSHTTVLKTIQIKSVSALQSAIEYLKSQGVDCDLVEGSTPRMYYPDQHTNCDYVLKLNKAVYDIGFEKQKDGSYAPVYDSYAGYIQKEVGAPTSCPVPKTEEERQAMAVSRLLDCYAVMAAKEELQNSGNYYSYSVDYDKTDGSYTLEATESY
jgi:hypothetical protein